MNKKKLKLSFLLCCFFFILFSPAEAEIPRRDELFFENNSSNQLKGYLYLPAKNDPDKLVIFITSVWYGLEPDFSSNSDSLFNSIKKYVQHLTNNECGVLLLNRGNYFQVKNNRSISINTVVEDAKIVLDYLKNNEIYNKLPIGIMGASEVGCAASIIAAQCEEIDFTILISTPGVTGIEERRYDTKNLRSPILTPTFFSRTFVDSTYTFNDKQYIFSPNQKSAKILYDNFYQGIIDATQQTIMLNDDYDSIISSASKFFLTKWEGTKFKNYIDESNGKKISFEEYIHLIVYSLLTPRYIEFAKWNPTLYLPKIDCPVLMLYGEEDVNINLKDGIDSIKNTIEKEGLSNYSIKTYKGLDHFLFPYIESEKKLPTISVPDSVIVDIIDWISKIK